MIDVITYNTVVFYHLYFNQASESTNGNRLSEIVSSKSPLSKKITKPYTAKYVRNADKTVSYFLSSTHFLLH